MAFRQHSPVGMALEVLIIIAENVPAVRAKAGLVEVEINGLALRHFLIFFAAEGGLFSRLGGLLVLNLRFFGLEFFFGRAAGERQSHKSYRAKLKDPRFHASLQIRVIFNQFTK